MSHRRRSPSLFRALILCLALLAPGAALGQERDDTAGRVVLRAADYEARTHVPSVAAASKRQLAPAATIEVTYTGFPQQARAAFAHAVDIWETLIASPVPIQIDARWEPLESDVLGAASPSLIANFDDDLPDTWYPTATAASLTGIDWGEDDADIYASFNGDFGAWYFGLDGRPPDGTYDFVTVVLHEIAHGLGFTGSLSVDDGDPANGDECPSAPAGYGCWGLGEQGYPVIYDLFAEDARDVSLLDGDVYPNPSLELADVLQSDAVFFNGVYAQATNLDVPVDLHAPRNFEPGSSYSHLAEDVFPAGDLNSLMTPQLALSEAIHSPGPLACGIFQDIGWRLAEGCRQLLSLGLVAFEADASGDRVSLSWQALNAATTDFFEIQRRYYNDAFQTVDVVDTPASAGTETFTYEADDLPPGRYTYRIRQVMRDGRVFFSAEATVFVSLPDDFYLSEAYPNPFADRLNVALLVDEAQQVSADLFDVRGRRVGRLFAGRVRERERRLLVLDAAGLPGGTYFIRVVGEHFHATRTAVHVP